MKSKRSAKDVVLKGKDGKLSSQELFLSLGADKNFYVNEILLWGTRGGGKTHSLILDYVNKVLLFPQHKITGVLFRMVYPALKNVIDTAKKVCEQIFTEDEYTFYSKPELKVVFKNGSELLFRAIDSVKDYETKYHGQEYQWMGFDELSTWPNLIVYDLTQSCLRYSGDGEIPLTVRSTTNPWGPGIEEIEKRFLKTKSGVISEKKMKVGDEEIVTRKMNIFSSWIENYKLDKDYPIQLAKSALTNKSQRLAFMKGEIDRNQGSFLGGLLSTKALIKPFRIPSSWVKSAIMGYDDGTSSPFSVLWSVESDGTTFEDADGNTRWVPKGSMFIINEYYGAKNLETVDIGLDLPHSVIAENIKAINNSKIKDMLGGRVANCGPSDTSIHSNTRGKGEATVYDIFKRNGLNWDKTKKYNGSRINSANVLKNMLNATLEEDTKERHLYIFNTCNFLIYNLGNLKKNPNNPDDIVEENKDHDYDVLRYLISYKKEKSMKTYY